MDVAITNHGAIRPEELLRLVDLENTMLDGESVLERVKLVLEDEQDCREQENQPDLRQRLVNYRAALASASLNPVPA